MTDAGRPAPDGGSSYCSNCGSALDPADSFCSDCGVPVDGGTTRDDEAAARRQFRTRVNGYLADGWDVEYDAGDEVVLADRSFGSGWVHVPLFLLTGGIGNCIYGWYSYEKNAERIVLRADGSADGTRLNAPVGRANEVVTPGDDYPTPGASTDRSLRPYVAGIFLFLLGVYVIATSLTDVGSLLFGVGLALVSLLVFPPVRERLRDRHPPTTVGPTRTTEQRAVSGTNQLCSVCHDTVKEGVVREYEEEYVVAGIPLFTTEAGENWYCRSCHRDRHQFDAGEDEPVELEYNWAPSRRPFKYQGVVVTEHETSELPEAARQRRRRRRAGWLSRRRRQRQRKRKWQRQRKW